MPRLVRCSFDFDDTLTQQECREYYENLLDRGFDCWIVTQRPPTFNRDIYDFVKKVGGDLTHVVFTDLEHKWPYMRNVRPVFHVENNWMESTLIKKKTSTVPINYGFNPKWREECEFLLRPYTDEFGYSIKPSVRARN